MGTVKKMDSIGLRISSDNKELIRMAAEYTGQDMTSYLVSNALEKARKDILEYHKVTSVVELSKRDFDTLEKELESPVRPLNERMQKAIKRRKQKLEK